MTMRIAWFGPGPEAGGGSLGVATVTIQQLASRGHEVTVFAAGPREYTVPTSLAEIGNVTWNYVPVADRLSRLLQPRSRALDFLARQAMKMPAQRRLFRSMLAMHAKQPFDVIYAFSQLELPGARRDELLKMPPIVFHPGVHAAGELRSVARELKLVRSVRMAGFAALGLIVFALRARWQRRSLRTASAVIAMSERFADLIAQDCGVDRSIIQVVSHPITDHRPASSVKVGSRDGSPTVLGVYIGRIAVRKGVELITELSHRIATVDSGVSLQVAGSPSPWSDYRRLLTYLNPVNAAFVGPLRHDDVSAKYDEADFALVTSSYEPFGLSAGEALLRGIPVVATSEVGAVEGLSRPAAFIIPPADAAALQEAVVAVAETVRQAPADELRKTVIDMVGDRFSPAAFGERLDSALRSVVASRAASGPEAIPQR